MEASAANRAGFWHGISDIYADSAAKKEYLKTESIMPRMLETYSRFSNQYGIIRTHIVSALTSFYLYGLERQSHSSISLCNY